MAGHHRHFVTQGRLLLHAYSPGEEWEWRTDERDEMRRRTSDNYYSVRPKNRQEGHLNEMSALYVNEQLRTIGGDCSEVT